MDVEEEVSRHLQALRYVLKASGWTQVRVQQRLGWRQRHVSDLLNRKKILTFEELFAILDLIGYTPAEYFRLATTLPVRTTASRAEEGQS
ncbi:MAG TPA: helix-turn-helix transcriptional regulator [Thermoanaerobaculia bacterium]|jgi:transcriptional regulator with XRE-family HTH domain